MPESFIHTIILKDEKCGQSHIDLENIENLQKTKAFKIFDEGYAKYVLCNDKPAKSANQFKVKEMRENYQDIIVYIKSDIKQILN